MRPFTAAVLPTFGIVLVVGTMAGLLRAAAAIGAHRYAELDMPGMILWTLERMVVTQVVSLVLVGAVAVLICALVDLVARHTGRRGFPPALVPVVPALGLGAIVAVGGLDWLPLVPRLSSARGAVAALALFSAGLAALLWVSGRRPAPFDRVERRLPVFHPRNLVPLIVLVAVLPVARYARDRVVRDEGPNVVLITVDTLRADHLGAYGARRATSPNIDALAREGIRFDTAIAQWPKTTPSVASFMTGTYGSRNGVVRRTRQRIPPAHLILAELLREAGYRCAAVLTNPNLGTEFGFGQGFDHYLQTWRGWPRPGSQRADRVSDRAIQWLRHEGRRGKFFLWVHYLDPHTPYRPPPPYDRMFVGDRWYRAGGALPVDDDEFGDLGAIPRSAALPGSRDPAFYIAQYDAEIRYVDAHIGRVLDELRTLGLSGDTLVVLTSDHGESLGEHDYWFQHGKLPYEDCLRVPFILRGPGMGPPRTVTAPIELIRLLPTVLDYAGLPETPQAQARSLLPLLRDPAAQWPRHAYAEAGYADAYQRVVRTERWKLVHVPAPEDRAEMAGTEYELYDLFRDPREERNLLGDRPEIARSLAFDLRGWTMTAGAKGSEVAETVEVDEQVDAQLRSLGYAR